MLYAFLIALAIAVVLGIAYYFELKSSRKQADEQKQLLADYQRRVDEQQKLLEDYRALEKNFDNVGEGYEQALLAFDKMEEEKEKSRQANEALEKRCNALFVELNQLKEQTQKKAEVMNPLMQHLQSALRATGDIKLQGMLAKVVDLDDIPADLPQSPTRPFVSRASTRPSTSSSRVLWLPTLLLPCSLPTSARPFVP